MRLVTLTDVSLRLGNRPVLAGINLALDGGHITTLVGPNGAGKTSLARLVLGLIAPGTGSVARAPGLVIGYMPQRLTVENTLPLTVRRFAALSGAAAADIHIALARTGVAHLADAAVQTLSGGEFQRLLLARAMARKPQLLVLDEPAQGVDISGQNALYGLVSDLRDETGCGVLMISHDLHLVMAESDTVICINNHICCHGTPEAVSVHPSFVELFGDGHAPPATKHVAVYTHHHDHAHALDGHVHAGHGKDCCK
jgi:zinc transport system ATP-binding protein